VESGGKVSVRVSKGKEREACVEVADNGCGIGKDDLPFIFDRFYRTSEGGIGIGLAIVKELVEAHEGRIDVKSEKGAGTSFKVFIPQRGGL
jgi:signal transduction histidine kinase